MEKHFSLIRKNGSLNEEKKKTPILYIFKKKKIFLIDTKNVKDEGKTFSIKISFQYHNIYDISTRREKKKEILHFLFKSRGCK